jgi:hypothetical protein
MAAGDAVSLFVAVMDCRRAVGVHVAVEQLVRIDIGSLDLPGSGLVIEELLRLGIVV